MLTALWIFSLLLQIGLIVVLVLIGQEYHERFRRLENNPQFTTWMGERDKEIKDLRTRLGDAEARLKALNQRTSRSTRPEAIVSPLVGNYIDTRPGRGAHRWRDEGRAELEGPVAVEGNGSADEEKEGA
jgi:hypothetical protein